jgi:hypothetical protein
MVILNLCSVVLLNVPLDKGKKKKLWIGKLRVAHILICYIVSSKREDLIKKNHIKLILNVV